MSLTENQKAYLHDKLGLVSELPSLYQGVGGWDAAMARYRAGSTGMRVVIEVVRGMLADAQAKQAAALAYLVESGADQETQDSLGQAAECFREVGRIAQQMRRCRLGSKRWQDLDERHTGALNRGYAARDKYNLWVVIQAGRQP